MLVRLRALAMEFKVSANADYGKIRLYRGKRGHGTQCPRGVSILGQHRLAISHTSVCDRMCMAPSGSG